MIAQVLPGIDQDVSVFAARRVTVNGDRLLRWVEAIDELKRSPNVHAIGRFSNPPRTDDLASLTLDAPETAALMRCRTGDCAFKLTADERQRIQASNPANAAAAFRDVLVRRVESYQRTGLAALGRYDDGRTPQGLEEASGALVTRLPCLPAEIPELAQTLARDPHAAPAPARSFFYWSKEEFRDRPVVVVTRVVALQRHRAGRTDTVVAGRQIYAAHYMNGSLNLTGVVDMPDGRHYLFVLNRTSVDVLTGMFGRMVRGYVERRLRSDVATVIDQVGRRIEAGLPTR